MSVCLRVRKRDRVRESSVSSEGRTMAEGERGTEKERGRPASKSLDLHEKKHVAIFLLTSAASGNTKSGCLLFTDSFSSIDPQTSPLDYIFSEVRAIVFSHCVSSCRSKK